MDSRFLLPRLVAVGLLSAGLVRAESVHDTYAETHPLDPRGLVRIDDTNGSVEIRTWDRPEVSLQVEKRASTEEYLREIQVTVESDPQSLSIRTVLPHHLLSWLWHGGGEGSVNLVLTVPASVDLKKVALVNGPVSIAGVRGRVEARTVNGALQVTGLESDAELTTVNGAIHLEVAALASGGHLHLTTINGAIAVRLPASANATVDATTINGGVECALPIRLTDEGGRHSLHGIIGTGGASLSATTVNGGIRLDPI